MTNHTAKALPVESGAPSERPETQGDLWREIAEDGTTGLIRRKNCAGHSESHSRNW